MILDDYQKLVLFVLIFMDGLAAAMVVFSGYAVVRFPRLRKALEEAIQDGDEKYHWIDAKSFGFFVAGWISALFTMNMALVFAFARMFDLGPMGFIALFVAVTFTLWGIAWKK
jgi:hypothetical protein